MLLCCQREKSWLSQFSQYEICHEWMKMQTSKFINKSNAVVTMPQTEMSVISKYK